MESSPQEIYKVDQLKAMMWVQNIWENMESSLIYICWNNTVLTSKCHVSNTEPISSMTPEQQSQELEKYSIVCYFFSSIQKHASA